MTVGQDLTLLYFILLNGLVFPVLAIGVAMYVRYPAPLGRYILTGVSGFTSLAFSVDCIVAFRPGIEWETLGWWMLATVPPIAIWALVVHTFLQILDGVPLSGRSRDLSARGG